MVIERMIAVVVEWQTHTFEGRVPERECGFKSRPRHSKSVSKRAGPPVGDDCWRPAQLGDPERLARALRTGTIAPADCSPTRSMPRIRLDGPLPDSVVRGTASGSGPRGKHTHTLSRSDHLRGREQSPARVRANFGRQRGE